MLHVLQHVILCLDFLVRTCVAVQGCLSRLSQVSASGACTTGRAWLTGVLLCRAQEEPYIASMGIYVAKASAIRDLLIKHFPEVSALWMHHGIMHQAFCGISLSVASPGCSCLPSSLGADALGACCIHQANDFGSEVIPGAKDMGMHIQVWPAACAVHVASLPESYARKLYWLHMKSNCLLLPLQAYLYDGYWEDIGTIEAFYESNLALTDSPSPKFR